MANKAPSSKYKYLLGTPAQPTECINGVPLGSIGPDSNVIKANSKWIGVPWKITGGLGIFPLTTKGALLEDMPLILQEDGINEFSFNPFDENVVATASQSGVANLWTIPDEGITKNLERPTSVLSGHSKRLMFLEWHPLANNVLATATADEVKLWDVAASSVKVEFPKVYKGQVTSVTWNNEGSLCATASKDKFLRIVDPRSASVVSEVQAHQGAKGWRAVWCGRKDRIVTVGFNKEAGREICLWDASALAKPIATIKLDVSPAAPMPFYDADTDVLYLGSKGEGSIKLYEVLDGGLTYLNDYKSPQPASGMAILNKRSVDVKKCEVAKFLKLTAQGQIVPIRFEVPRSNMNIFHDDLFPDTFDGFPAVDSAAWFGGDNGKASYVSMQPK